MSFDDAIAVTKVADGRYTCDISPDYWIVAGPNGGYIGALLVNAAEDNIGDPSRQLAGMTVHYLRRPQEGPAELRVATLHHGRSIAYRRVELIQDDIVIAAGTGSWAVAMDGIEVGGWEAPDVPAPDDCLPMSAIRTTDPLPFHQQWDIKTVDGIPFGEGGDDRNLVMTWWFRPAVHRLLDGALIFQIADAMPPPIFLVAMPAGGAPTIDLSVHVRARLDDVAWNEGDWLLIRFSTRYGSNGFVEEDGEIWTADGTLLAHSRQLALAR